MYTVTCIIIFLHGLEHAGSLSPNMQYDCKQWSLNIGLLNMKCFTVLVTH